MVFFRNKRGFVLVIVAIVILSIFASAFVLWRWIVRKRFEARRNDPEFTRQFLTPSALAARDAANPQLNTAPIPTHDNLQSVAAGGQWRYALASGNVAAPLAITADNNDHKKWNLTPNHRHPHATVTGVITPGGANPDGEDDYDALASILSTSWEEGDESYFCAAPLNANGYFPLTGASASPDHGSEQCDIVNRRSDSCGDSRASLLRSICSASEEFELQRMPAKPAPIAVSATSQELGVSRQVHGVFEVGPSSHGIQSTSTQQHQSVLDENHQSKRQLKRTTASTSRKSWFMEKLRRKH